MSRGVPCMLVLASVEGVSRCALYMLDCEDWRVCHGVLSACWSVKIGIGRGCVTVCSLHVGLLRLASVGGVSRCAPCMLVCEDWHRQGVCHGVLSACWSVKIGIGRGCIMVCSLHVGLGIGRGCVISACWSVYSVSWCALCMLVC